MLHFGVDQIKTVVSMATESSHKWCLCIFSVTFNEIFVKLAGKADRHKILHESEFGLDRTFHYRVICP